MTYPALASIRQQLAFLAELDRLKSVVRQSPLVDRSRKENSAEHSWHLAMFALVLAVGRHRGTSRRRHLAPIHLGSRFTQIG